MRTHRTFQDYLRESVEHSPYLAALWDATQSAKNDAELDAIIAAFPEPGEWYQQHEHQEGGSRRE